MYSYEIQTEYFYYTSHCLFDISGPNEIDHKPVTYAS